MYIGRIVVTSLLGLALAGCHSDPNVAALERDNRKKEWEIYQLRNRVQDLEEALGACGPQTGKVVQRGLPPGEMPPEPETMEGPWSGPAAARPGPILVPAKPANPQPETFPGPGTLNVSPGMETPPGEIPERMKVPGDSAPPWHGSPSSGPSSNGPAPGGSSQWSPTGGQPLARGSTQADNGAVAQITLHPALTGGIGAGSQLGDEGLLVVVEPRDFGGNIVAAPGDISVAVLDPALGGERARLGRWDFSAAQTEQMVRMGSQPGIHLRLPWTSAPKHDRLKVFVRYTTRDGRKLQTERLIAVALNRPPPREPLPDAEPPQTVSRPQWSPTR